MIAQTAVPWTVGMTNSSVYSERDEGGGREYFKTFLYREAPHVAIYIFSVK